MAYKVVGNTLMFKNDIPSDSKRPLFSGTIQLSENLKAGDKISVGLWLSNANNAEFSLKLSCGSGNKNQNNNNSYQNNNNNQYQNNQNNNNYKSNWDSYNNNNQGNQNNNYGNKDDGYNCDF